MSISEKYGDNKDLIKNLPVVINREEFPREFNQLTEDLSEENKELIAKKLTACKEVTEKLSESIEKEMVSVGASLDDLIHFYKDFAKFLGTEKMFEKKEVPSNKAKKITMNPLQLAKKKQEELLLKIKALVNNRY